MFKMNCLLIKIGAGRQYCGSSYPFTAHLSPAPGSAVLLLMPLIVITLLILVLYRSPGNFMCDLFLRLVAATLFFILSLYSSQALLKAA